MIKPLAIRLLMMSTMASCAFAAPVVYNITFTATSGPAPTAGSFTYNASAPLGSQFSGFNVAWAGGLYDLTAAANTGEQFTGTNCGTTPSSLSVFTFLSGQSVCTNAAVIAWDGGQPGGIDTFTFRNQELPGPGASKASISINSSTAFATVPDATGTFSISSVPEPSTIVLTPLAVIFFMRRKLTRVVRAK